MQVLLLEDDSLQARNLRESLEQDMDAEVIVIGTEMDFADRFESIALNPPDVAVLDRMVRWANPSPSLRPPPEHPWDQEQGGRRCADMLRADPRTQTVPIVLYSVLGEEENSQGYETIVKEPEFFNLLEQVKELISQRSGLKRS